MTDKQPEQKTSGKSGHSIGFLRAAEKMQISTFEIPLTFLEDLGFSPDKIQAAKYMNRRFVSGFYDRVRGIGERTLDRLRPLVRVSASSDVPTSTLEKAPGDRYTASVALE